MAHTNRLRWSVDEKRYGPFTYAPDSYGRTELVLDSGDGDEDVGCRARFSAFGHTLIIDLPQIIQPWREKVYPKGWDAETIARIGRDWYWNTAAREYGFSLSRSGGGIGEPVFLQVFLGRQTGDSSTTQSWSKFLPWTDWRHVRHSMYGLEGEHVWTEGEYRPRRDTPRQDRIAAHTARMEVWREAKETCPSRTFAFADFDGEHLTARTRIEEREWRFGTGWFRWLSHFRKPLIIRRLEIEFSGETGKRKGSWKGGTLGTNGPIMSSSELHEPAFRRYCGEHDMTFLSEPAEAAS